MKRIGEILEEVVGIVKDTWTTAEDSGFCCGVHLDRPNCCKPAPTPSSCCGVRA